jgi:hypothetical protein
MSDLAVRLAAGFRDARSRLDEQETQAVSRINGLAADVDYTDYDSSRDRAVEVSVFSSRRQLDALEQIAGLHESGPKMRTISPTKGNACQECSDFENGMTVPWPCPTFYLVAAGLEIDL